MIRAGVQPEYIAGKVRQRVSVNRAVQDHDAAGTDHHGVRRVAYPRIPGVRASPAHGQRLARARVEVLDNERADVVEVYGIPEGVSPAARHVNIF